MRVLFALLTSLAIAPVAMAQTKPITTASGLVFESIKEGTGDSPKATDTVPDGQVKFPHPWPPQIPPGRTTRL